MNGIEKITGRIAADSESQAEALMARSQEQAKAIFAGYQAAADRDYQESLKTAKKDAAERVERLGSVAHLEARKLQLSARQEMLDKAFDLALRKLLNLPEDQYAKLLTDLAVRASQTGREALVFSRADRSRYGKRVVLAANEALEQQGRAGNLTLSEESRDFQGGLYLQDGRVETNCTFAAMIRLQRQAMSRDVADILFD